MPGKASCGDGCSRPRWPAEPTSATSTPSISRPAARRSSRSDAFALGAFRDSGLVEAFQTATVTHILTGEARGVPFGLAEIALLDAKGYRMFGGVLASFRLARARPGLHRS